MAKAPVVPVENLQNEPSALGRINDNFQTLSDAIERSLSRGDEAPGTPNQMDVTLDMNNQRIINLPPPVSPTEPARHGQLQQYVDEAEAARDAAEGYRDEAFEFRNETEAFRDETHDLWYDFRSRYLGVHASDPVADLNGDPLTEGAIYFNSTSRAWRVYNIRTVYVDNEPVYVGDELVEVHQWEELPRGTLNELLDVNAGPLVGGDILRWNQGTQTWEPWAFSAGNVTYSNAVSNLDATNVQAAIDEVIDRSFLNSYDIAFYLEGLPVNDEVVLKMLAVRAFYFPAGMAGSLGHATVPANAAHQWQLRRNGVSFGTINWGQGDSSPTFSVAANTLIDVGDIFTIHGAAVADTLLRDVSLTLRAWRP